MKTGVLVHGCNLHIENWRHVAWGDPPHDLGRIPHGVLIAHQYNATVIVLGTGASHKPFRFGERKDSDRTLVEAEYGFEYLRKYFHQLSQFEVLRNRIPELAGDQIGSFKVGLLDRVVLDLNSRNTEEEILNAGDAFLKAGVERVFLVSSPSHVVRCLRDATATYVDQPRFAAFRHNLFASPSVTCYEGSTASDVVVVEPPHRPDRHVIPTHRRIQRMLTLQTLDHDDLVKLIEEFDDMLQRYEHRYFTR